MGVRRPVGSLDPADGDDLSRLDGDEEAAVEHRVFGAQFAADPLRAVALGIGEGVDDQGDAGVEQQRTAAVERVDPQLGHPLLRGRRCAGGAGVGQIRQCGGLLRD